MHNETSTLRHGWISTPNIRGTFDVIWSCFFTIFVCAYTVLHLNLPAADERIWQARVRKIRWMVLAIIMPEVVTAAAFAQLVAARQSVEAMNSIGCEEWSKRHAFYVNMGGVWLQPKESAPFPVNAAQLNYLIAEGVVRCPSLTAKEIWDKSKADGFAKLLACLQIGWLSLQCIGRAIQHLPISLLETATMGFALPSLATVALWFHKPLDVETPTILPLEVTLAELLDRVRPRQPYEWHDTPLDFITTVNGPSFVSEVVLKSPVWPWQESYRGPATRIRNDVFGLKYSKLDQLFVFSIWAGYAGVHFSAWNYQFPSYTEKIMWRVCCIAMVGTMVLFWITGNRKFYLLVGYLWPSRRKKMEEISSERSKVSVIQIFMGVQTTLCYFVARVCLIVQALIALRALPAGVFNTVNWVNFIPHV